MLKSKKHFFVNLVQVLLVAFMVISSGITSFVRVDAEDNNPMADVHIDSILYSESQDGPWLPLTKGTVVKEDMYLKIKGGYDLRNVYSVDGGPLELEVPLNVENIVIPDYARSKIADGFSSEFEIVDNVLKIHVTAEDRKKSNVSGNLNLDGQVKANSSTVKDGDEMDIKIGESTTKVKYDANLTPSSLSAEKKADGNIYKGEDGNFYQKYQLAFYASNGDVTVNQISDVLGANLSLASQITITKADGTQSVVNDFSEINNFVVPKDSSVTVSYTTKVNVSQEGICKGDLSVANGYGNSFKANYTNNVNETKDTYETTITPKVVEPSVKKTGSYDADSKTVTWTVSIDVGSYADIYDAAENSTLLQTVVKKIEDTLDEALEIVDGADPTNPANYVQDTNLPSCYTYTYTTKVKDGVDLTKGKNVKNTVETTFVNDEKKDATGKVTIGAETNFITKTFDHLDYENELCYWNVDITLHDQMSDVTFSDNPDWHQKNQTNFIVKMGDEILYDNGQVNSDYIENWTEYSSLSLKFKESFVEAHKKQPIRLQVVTKLNGKSHLTDGATFENSATLNYKIGGDSFEQTSKESHQYQTSIEKSGEALNDGTNGIKYTIKTGLTDYAGIKAGDVLAIQDHLDPRYTIDVTSIKGSYNSFRWITGEDNPVVTYDKANHTFTYVVDETFINGVNNLPNSDRCGIVITYYAYPVNSGDLYSEANTNHNNKIYVSNQANATINGSDFGHAGADNEITLQKLVTKTGTWKNGQSKLNYATWTIDINPGAVLLNGGNRLTAIDKLGNGLDYKLDTIKVTDKTNGIELNATEYSCVYDEQQHSLTFTIPDGKYLEIQYETNINLEEDTKFDENNAGNALTLLGNNDTSYEIVDYHLDGTYSPTITMKSENANLTISKFDSQDATRFLSGAKFNINEVKYDSTKDEMQVVSSFKANDTETDFVTGDNGTKYIEKLKLDVIYEIREVEAPSGYALASSKYVVFKGKDFNRLKLPDGSSKYSVKTINNLKNATISIGDDKLTTDVGKLQIEKSFESHNVTATDLENITFEVRNPAGTEIKTFHLKDFTNTNGIYSKTITNLPVGEYTVTETNTNVPNGYVVTTTYKVNGADTTGGKVSVVKDTQSVVSIHNKYENQLGKLKLTKTITGLPDTVDTKDITFVITGPENYQKTIRLEEMDFDPATGLYSKTLPGLTPGDYTVTETSADFTGYSCVTTVNGNEADSGTVTVSKDAVSNVDVTNTYTKILTSFTVNKTWDDTNYANRPTFVKVQLKNGNQTVDTVTLDNNINWTYTWDNLDKYDTEGNEISYSVTEIPVDGYITSINGGEITNTITRVNVSKVDAADLHVVTGAHLQVLDGTSVVDEWDSADSVHEILGMKVGTEYTLHETVAPSGYKLASDITFKIKSNGKVESAGNVDENETLLIKDEQIAKTSYTVEKEWADNNNAKGRRPESVVVYLLRDGSVYGDSVTLSAENNWTNTWNDLDVTDANNHPYTYSVSEDTVGHYIGSETTSDNITKLTNTYVDNSKIVKIAKTDVNGNLLGGAVLSVKDTTGNTVASWTSVKDEEKELSLEPGKYTLYEESAPAGYELASDIEFEVTDDGSVKVNGGAVDRVSMQDRKIKTSFTVNKNWTDHDNAKGKRPNSVEVHLNIGNQIIGSVILNADNSWTYTWNDLDEFDSEGHEIAYYVTETPVDGYTTSISGGEITNTLDEGKLKLTKTITGLPDTVDTKDITFVITGPENYQTTIQLKDMYFDPATGLYSKTLPGLTPGDYTVTETSADFTGYSCVTTVNGNEADSGTVTVSKDAVSNVDVANTYTEKLGRLVITKTISGNVTEEALNNVKFVVMDPEGNTTEFTLASMKQTDGSYKKELSGLKPGTYTVSEENAEVSGYELTTTYTVNGIDTNEVSVVGDEESSIEIHNDYRHKEGTLEFTKTFTGSIPEGVTDTIQFKVTKEDGTEVGTYRLKDMDMDENGVYHQTITGLEPGKYTVTEGNAGVDGYALTTTYKVGENDTQEVEVIDQNTSELDITNTYTEKPGKLVITKTVSGNVTEEALNNVKFVVMDPEGNTTEFTLASMKQTDGSYKKELTDLKPGTYMVSEENADVEHYVRTTIYKVGENEIDGSVDVPRDSEVTVNVTNTYTFVPEKTSYTVTKGWDDNDNAKGRRPESIVVHLLRDGAVYGDSVTLSAENNWTYTWSNLDATDANNHPYTYSVSEDTVGHYIGSETTSDNITKLTNTYVDNSKIVKIAKTDVNGNLLGGAVLSVKDTTGNTVASWTSVKDEEKELSLEPGKYTLYEESAPLGYEVASDVAFEVTENGGVKVNGEAVDCVKMVDKDSSFDVTISKVDAGSGKALSGAKLQLKNSSGDVVTEWTSKDKKVVSLTKGVYTLHEVEAPENYKLAEDIVFEVNQYGDVSVDGKRVDIVVMKDAPKAKIVDTSDHSHVSWNSLLGVVSLAMAGMMLYLRKRVN